MAFADVVALTIAYLDPIVAVPVSSRVPNPKPDEFIQVRRVGGTSIVPFRESVVLDVWAWAQDEPRAYELANIAREAMWQLRGSDLLGVTSYEVDERLSPRTLDDPETGDPRVWATYVLVVRANDIVPYTPSIP